MHVVRSFLASKIWPGRVALLLASAGLALLVFVSAGLEGAAQAKSAPLKISAPAAQGPSNGAAIFNTKCAGCHTIGGGKLIGPDLKDVMVRRDPDWVKRFISDPPKMLASDPTAQKLLKENNNVSMPNLGLSPAEVEDLVDFLKNPGVSPAAPALPAAAPGTGDPLAGQKMFTGETWLANGGTPCIACHTVTGTGGLGGGALGPNLTHVIQRLGVPGVTAALQTIAFPTMLGPYQNHPLSADERADLVAFLITADRQQGPVPISTQGALTINTLLVFSIATMGAAVLFGLLFFIWLRQRRRTSAHLPVRKL
jgi:mono/diheme cytochrome c family protein